MRATRVILIVLVLVGFPALSWYYLSSGLKWRITAQDDTVKKERITDFTLLKSDSTWVSDKDLRGIFYLIARPQDSASFHHLDMIHTQFHVRGDFRMLYLTTPELDMPVIMDTTRMGVICQKGCEALQANLFGKEYSATIIDDSLYVRGRYRLSSRDEMKKMVEHLAVVLPIDKRERIELKRGNQ